MNNIRLTFCLFLLSSSLFAQWEDPSQWQHYFSLEMANDWIEWNDDIWLATNKGLAQVNKDDFSSTYYFPWNSSLPSQHIQTVAVDAQDQLWIGTYDNVLARFDGQDFIPVEIPVDEDALNVNEVPIVYCLEIDENNIKWVGTNYGLVRYDDTEWTIFNKEEVDDLAFKDVWAIDIDEEGVVYSASFMNFKYDGDTWENISLEDNLFSYGGATFYRSSEGLLYYTNHFGEIAAYDGNSWTISSIFTDSLWSPAPPTSAIRGFFEDANQTMHLVTEWHGQYRLENGIWENYYTPQNATNGSPAVQLILQDSEDNTWMISDVFYSKYDGNDVKNGRLGPYPFANDYLDLIQTSPDGSMYFIEYPKSLYRYHPDAGWEIMETPMDTFSVYVSFFDMKVSTEGHLWLGTGEGLFEFDGTDWTLHQVPTYAVTNLDLDADQWPVFANNDGIFRYENGAWKNVASDYGLSNISWRKVEMASDGTMWLYNTDAEVYGLFPDGSKVIYNQYNSPIDNEYLQTIYLDEMDRLWIAEVGTYLHMIDDGNWETFNLATIVNDTYCAARAVFQDKEENIRVATSDGLLTYDGSNWTIRNTSNSLLLDNYIYQVAQDAFGNIWLGVIYHGWQVVGNAVTTSSDNNPTIPTSTITISPNPASSEWVVQLELPSAVEESRLELLNDLGQIVQVKPMNRLSKGEHQWTFEREQLPAGIYWLRFSTPNQTSTLPLILR